MTKTQRIAYILIFPLLFATLPGCLITTQSFNHGKLLNPGERMLTHGVGYRYSARTLPTYEEYRDSTGYHTKKVWDSTRVGWCTYTLDYRVGVLRTYPFGKGLETGFHLEAAFRGTKYQNSATESGTEPEFYGPPALEIDTRFGLPDKILQKGILHHNVNIGWVIGYWVDNGWFLGYAAGWEFERIIPYCSARLFLTATNALDQSLGDADFFTKHNRRLGCRLTGGASIRLPFNFSILPEFVSPECSFAFPHYATGQPAGFNAALGIRWMLGQ